MFTTTFYQLELLQLFPDYFKSLGLSIPNDAPGPDLLKECLFELDLFRRLQLPDGGCRFGIETNGDPGGGEVSWKQHMPGYVYAPDIFSSYLYAAIAARTSQVLETCDAKLAGTYRAGALGAMRWAEADRARRLAKKRLEQDSATAAGHLRGAEPGRGLSFRVDPRSQVERDVPGRDGVEDERRPHVPR